MISIDWTIILQFVNFLVLMAVLNALLYRPLRKVLAQRKEKIDASHQRAKDLEAQIEEKMTRYQEQLQAAKIKGSQERAAMRSAATAEEAKLIGAAREEAAQRLLLLKGKVAEEAAVAEKTLRAETEGIAGSIAAKVLGRALA
ncbi:MAG: ATP synthase F0 subunit B [Desulfuromonadales bacterium]|nr:ATP synthase F0 subunit B [Desulfuromonadales bacterium]MDT8422655.1 ATP synthase F0 subunit B [Desulfuromonadales bacterium]